MHKLCEYIDDELKELEKKVGNGHELTEKELEYADTLAHLKKSILTNETMEGSGYSGGTYRHWNDDRSYGRGRTAHRDSMGRYSRDYSYAREDMMSELREIMKDAPDEETKRKFKTFISELDHM